MINLRQYRYFLGVLESGSLLGASQLLNVSQPALSKSVTALERYYGVTLFERLPRGVHPTAFALALEPHARRILLDAEESRAEIASIADGASGHIAFGAGQSFVEAASEAMRDMDRCSPGARFTVQTDHADNLRMAVLANQIDFFVGMANRAARDAAFDVTHLFSDRFVGICAADHPIVGREVSAEVLARHEWIFPNMEEPARAALDAYFIANSHRPARVKITTNAEPIMRGFLDGTRYLSVQPAINMDLPGFEELGRFTLKGFDFERHVGIVRRAATPFSPVVKRFAALLSDRVIAMRPGPIQD